jgi:hypothetical protein
VAAALIENTLRSRNSTYWVFWEKFALPELERNRIASQQPMKERLPHLLV